MKRKKKKKISISFSICHENVTRKKTAWNKTSKKDRIIFLPVQVHHKSILQIPTQEEETRKCSRIRNRETLRDTLSDSHDMMEKWRGRKPALSSFFLLSFFFSLYAKNQSDRNIVETINQILLPALKKRDSQVFHVDFFPVVSPIKGEIFSPFFPSPNRTDRTKNNRRKIIWRACQPSVDTNYPIRCTRLKLKIWRFSATLADLSVVRRIL